MTDRGTPVELPTSQESLGRVGFVTGRSEPAYSFDAFVEGKGEGAARGLAGAGYCLDFVKGDSSGLGAALAIVCLPIAAVAGAIFGAAGAAHADAIVDARARAQEGIAAVHLNQVALQAGLDYASVVGLPLQQLDRGAGPAAPGDIPDYESFADKVDSVLEIDIVRVDASTSGSTDIPVSFDIEARTRLLDVRDGRTLYSHDAHYVTPERTADQWLAENGKLLQDALPAAVKDIVVRTLDAILDEIMIYRPAFATKVGYFDGLVPGYALRPVEPPLRLKPFGHMFKSEDYCDSGGVTYGWLELYHLESLQPTFRWEAMPREFDLPLGDGPGQAHDIRYDFRILDGSGKAYVRDGLKEPLHTLDEPLAPCGEFRWTVRARFTLDGAPRATEWTGAFNTIGGYADPAWIRGHPGKPALAAIPADMTLFFPIVLTPSADGKSCTCGSD
jgi:hypothetical protein